MHRLMLALLVRSPRPYIGHTGLVDPLESHMGILSARCRERPPHHLPLAGGVGQAVAGLKLHGEEPTRRSAGGLLLPLWPSHEPYRRFCVRSLIHRLRAATVLASLSPSPCFFLTIRTTLACDRPMRGPSWR